MMNCILGIVGAFCITVSDEVRDKIGRLAQMSRTSELLLIENILDEVEARLGWITAEKSDQFPIIFDDNRLTLRAVLLTASSIYVVMPQREDKHD